MYIPFNIPSFKTYKTHKHQYTTYQQTIKTYKELLQDNPNTLLNPQREPVAPFCLIPWAHLGIKIGSKTEPTTIQCSKVNSRSTFCCLCFLLFWKFQTLSSTLLDRYKVPFYHQPLEGNWGYIVSKDGQKRREPFRVKLNKLNALTTIKATTTKVWAKIRTIMPETKKGSKATSTYSWSNRVSFWVALLG